VQTKGFPFSVEHYDDESIFADGRLWHQSFAADFLGARQHGVHAARHIELRRRKAGGEDNLTVALRAAVTGQLPSR
jgi:hypothetical protein